MTTPDIYVVSAARTAIGTFGGSLKDVALTQLATIAVKRRSSAAASSRRRRACGDGQRHPDRHARRLPLARGRDRSRHPAGDPAYNVNRLCGSGLQAIVSAAQTLMLGDAEIAIGGGAESMSRSPYFMRLSAGARAWATSQATDYMLGILHDPFHKIHMGITAENVAERDDITREMQDALAVESHRRAAGPSPKDASSRRSSRWS